MRIERFVVSPRHAYEGRPFAAVKLATVAPDNPRRGLPRIAALAETLGGAALVDQAAAERATVTAGFEAPGLPRLD